MVILEAKLKPVIMELWNSLWPQQPAWIAKGEGEGHFGRVQALDIGWTMFKF